MFLNDDKNKQKYNLQKIQSKYATFVANLEKIKSIRVVEPLADDFTGLSLSFFVATAGSITLFDEEFEVEAILIGDEVEV